MTGKSVHADWQNIRGMVKIITSLNEIYCVHNCALRQHLALTKLWYGSLGTCILYSFVHIVILCEWQWRIFSFVCYVNVTDLGSCLFVWFFKKLKNIYKVIKEGDAGSRLSFHSFWFPVNFLRWIVFLPPTLPPPPAGLVEFLLQDVFRGSFRYLRSTSRMLVCKCNIQRCFVFLMSPHHWQAR